MSGETGWVAAEEAGVVPGLYTKSGFLGGKFNGNYLGNFSLGAQNLNLHHCGKISTVEIELPW